MFPVWGNIKCKNKLQGTIKTAAVNHIDLDV